MVAQDALPPTRRGNPRSLVIGIPPIMSLKVSRPDSHPTSTSTLSPRLSSSHLIPMTITQNEIAEVRPPPPPSDGSTTHSRRS
jgi:hypothetical protein